MKKQGFTELEVWRKSVKIVKPIYSIIAGFPHYEKNALSEQLRRCCVSISSNIAEGQARGSNRAFINHLNISKGSSAEVQSQLYVAVELGYTTYDIITPIEEELIGIDMMLNKLISSLERKMMF
ncbi:MAG: four helix bundle protein [Muribaculaceae bacterium]|nr:four helix bundle protein [Muribaculaceae bacterium]